MKKIFFCFLLSALSVLEILTGSTAVADNDLILLKDINQTPRALDIFKRCSAGTFEIVFASDRIRGIEPWLGDGVSKPAVLLKDIYPGAGSGNQFYCINFGGLIYFSADDGVNGVELWKTDGTPAGTVLVKDINPGSGNSNPEDFVIADNKLFLSASNGINGNELWVTDGTNAGTTMIEDFWPGSQGGYYGNDPLVIGSRIIFECANLVISSELCAYDAAAGGSISAIDIRAGSSSSTPYLITVMNGKAIFTANLPASGTELYSTDGTLPGTAIIKDLYPGAMSGVQTAFNLEPYYTVLNNKLYFPGNENAGAGLELYVTDGTSGGTALIKDIFTGATGSSPTSLRTVNGKVTFIATNSTNGEEPWISDGTPAGTMLLNDIEPGTSSSSFGDSLDDLPGTPMLAYSSETTANGYQLWGLNTTDSSAQRISNFFPGYSELYFNSSADRYAGKIEIRPPAPINSVAGDIVFLSDGTTAGTRVHPGALPSFTASSFPIRLGEMGGVLYFAADDGGSGPELWRTDGTAAGTYPVADINSGATWSVMTGPGGAVINGNTLLFVAVTEANGVELWKTDGTAAGTSMVKDIISGPASGLDAYYSKITSMGSFAVFSARTEAAGFELWRSDGTDAGTVMVQDIKPGPGDGFEDAHNSIFFNPTPSTGMFVFSASNAASGEEMFVYNGTSVNFLEINPGSASSNPNNFSLLPLPGGENGVVFAANNAGVGREPYYYAPSIPIAGLVKDVKAGASSSNPEYFVVTNPTGTNLQIFFAANVSNGTELYKFDELSGNATLVKDIKSGSDSSYPRWLTKLNDSTIVFSAEDNNGIINFFRSDGTGGGTVQLTSFAVSDPYGYSPIEGIIAKDGTAYFSAYNDVLLNYVPHQSNGTPEGTRPLTSQGIYYNNRELLATGTFTAINKVFFSLYSTSYGAEFFTLGEDQCPADANKSFPGICGCGVVDADTDGDGTTDCQDGCNSDALKASPGICGCGAVDSGDSDSDGTLNCVDQCSADPAKAVPGACGCGSPDLDLNSNGIADCRDASDTPLIKPAKAKIKAIKKKKKLTGKLSVQFENRPGAGYQVLYREVPVIKQRSKKLPKFKTKNILPGKQLTLKTPAVGKVLEIKYKFSVALPGGTTYFSMESAVVKYKRKR